MVKKILFLFFLIISFKGFSQTPSACSFYVNDASVVGDVLMNDDLVYVNAYGDAGNTGVLGTNTNPFGNLNDAISAAKSAACSSSYIYVNTGTYTRSGALNTQLTIDFDGLEIIGAGSQNTIFDGDACGSCSGIDFLRIESNNVKLYGLSATNYASDAAAYGKAITIGLDGGIGPYSVILEDFVAHNNVDGGHPAVLIWDNSDVTYRNSASSCNLNAGTEGGGIGIGTNDGNRARNVTLLLENCVIADNNKASANGGGLSVWGNSGINITINNSLFFSNGAGTYGGAIYLNGDGVDPASETNVLCTINNSCFEDNYLNYTSASGGAIHIDDEVTLTVNESSFTNNLASTSSSDGGAIGQRGNWQNVSINNCYFTGNSCADDGNALYSDGYNASGTTFNFNVVDSYFETSGPAQNSFNKSDGAINIQYSGTRMLDGGSSAIPDNDLAQRVPMPTTYCASQSTCGASVVVLPADDLTLTGYNDGNTNQLNWSSSSEQNTQYHILMRAGEDGVFEEISSQNAIGNSKSTTYYSDEDNNALPFGYYKIKVIDFDGETTTYSNIILLEKGVSKEEIEFTISPNPTNNSANVYITSKISDDMVLNIYNSIGQLIVSKNVYSSNNDNAITVDLSNYATGVYSIEVKNNETNKVERFVKL